MYDTIIIGGGSAGLTAAVYTCRKKMSTLVLTMDIGGQTNLPSNIENYPGFESGAGIELMNKFEKQARNFGAEIKFGKVAKVKKQNSNFLVEMEDKQTYGSKTIILAYGKTPRKINVPGEDKFMGKGVSTCVTCDAPLFKDKVVAVVGGGNSAVEGSLDLAAIAKKIYLIHRRDEFRADEFSVEQAKKEKKIEMVLSSVPKEIKGDKFVKSIVVENKKNNQERELEVDGIFIEIGYVVDRSMIKDLAKVNESNEIIVNNKNGTSCPGVFAAGDVTSTQYKQTVIAAGEGAKAALSAHSFLSGIKEASLDWLSRIKKK